MRLPTDLWKDAVTWRACPKCLFADSPDSGRHVDRGTRGTLAAMKAMLADSADPADDNAT